MGREGDIKLQAYTPLTKCTLRPDVNISTSRLLRVYNEDPSRHLASLGNPHSEWQIRCNLFLSYVLNLTSRGITHLLMFFGTSQVGAGPVGMVLALLLKQMGVPARIIEKNTVPRVGSKGAGLQVAYI